MIVHGEAAKINQSEQARAWLPQAKESHPAGAPREEGGEGEEALGLRWQEKEGEEEEEAGV